MIDKLKKALHDASETIKEQTSSISEGAKERTFKLIEEWLQIFPKLEIYGLTMSSFSLSVGLSPALDAELIGQHDKFKEERLQQIIDDNKGSTALVSVFSTIKTAYYFHQKTYAAKQDPLIVKISIRLSPEIKVIIGQPIVPE